MALTLTGCQSWPFAQTPVPVRLDAPTPACLARLSAQARQWTGKPVVLTTQAFATDARLVLEQPALLGADGRRLNGRIVDAPEVLTLVKAGETCRVAHPSGGEEADLPGCACQPLPKTSGPGPMTPPAPLVSPSVPTAPPPAFPPADGPTPGVS